MTTKKPKKEAPAKKRTAPGPTLKSSAADGLHVESVARAIRLLEAFADLPKPLSLSQLAAAAQIDKSASQRLARTLTTLGYLERVEGGLRPGAKLLDRAYDYLRSNPLIARSYAVLVDLRRRSEERVALCLFDDLTMVYAIRLITKQDAFFAHLPGRRLPTYCTSPGRAVLAALPEAQALDIIARSDLVALTPKTTVDRNEARLQVERARRAGYALAMEEVLIGELAVAAAVFDAAGKPVGAVSVAGSLGEWTKEKFVARYAPMVVAAAQAISES